MPHLLSHASGEHEVIAYGILLVVIMIFLPEGLVAGLRASLGARRQPDR
jgi:ABC-type branched-subunit amino acid transport system permease subunit